MKKYRKAIPLLLVSLLLLGGAMAGARAWAGELARQRDLARPRGQGQACEAYSVLYDACSFVENWQESCPPHYGGCYIQDNILHICIVDRARQDLTPYTELLADYLNVITFDDVTWPLDTLHDASDAIVDRLHAEGIVVSGWGADVWENAASIGVPQDQMAAVKEHAVEIGDGLYRFSFGSEYDRIPVLLYEEELATWGLLIESFAS